MIFCAHVREGRDIFLSDNVKAFGREGSPQRQRMSALALRTKIMTRAEFERFCEARRDPRGAPLPGSRTDHWLRVSHVLA